MDEVRSRFWHQLAESLELQKNGLCGLPEFLYLYKILKIRTSSQALSHSSGDFMSRLICNAQTNAQVLRFSFVGQYAEIICD